MADVKMPESIPCKFDAKGWRPCGKPSDNGLCSEHEGKKCKSCGAQALRTCDAQMGGLACGAYLCSTCQHGCESGEHVTWDVYRAEVKEQEERRRTGQESKRRLAERGVPIDVELPRHLKELLDTKPANFSLKICYRLRIKCYLMAEFPAVLKSTRILVITPDREAAIRVWRSLEPRDSEIASYLWMVNETLGVGYCYVEEEFYQKQSQPYKIFSMKEVDELFGKNDHPFEWSLGFIGAEVSQERFAALIEEEAAVTV